ncbi:MULTISPECIES: exosortase-associated EpsI family protein [unclassified Lentimonas]|uniref:exosortase-associated EpsI family protein n=1 Tax=unclassified Lentimonas TaxID=2630993 RepID=UPI0013242859|nr:MULTISPECIES: exosortase-associated EpsI family protein [unclassified Lentimonas]CAA6678253.1 Unannotated [Lentimonas sp. CC4]CAA6684851.1 Unannotated [Lentimonas sp. CC6]CAA7076794.1 Unannotated [Lentimonas sp. CC4]CAA7170808.1 Unannotated [Lentimonas sp. CC21]CAA7179629.1 Unannotated [Lentimonas sp. CC8]
MSDAVRSRSGSSIGRIGVPLAIATLIFFIFPVLGEIYELQLREFSAWLAEICLRITNLDISRKGTILSLPGMTFDIIPACSGSEMLRTLLFVGILWGGIHPGISPPCKVIATLLSALVALLANGLRLTLLIGFSYMRGEVIEEGLLHTLIGLSAFAIALPGFFVVTELLARRRTHDDTDTTPASNMLAFTLVLTSIVYLPVISACVVAWKGTAYNQYDTYGYLFFLVGAIAWVSSWKATTADYKYMKLGSILFAVTSLFALISQLPGPNYYVMGITLMASIFVIGLAYRSLHFALRCLPFQFIMFLSFPKVSEIINLALGTDGIVAPLLIKALLTVIALLFFCFVCLPIKRPFLPIQQMTRWSALMTVAAAVTLVGMLYLVRTDFKEEANTYALPYLLGANAEWEGSDIVDIQSLTFYQRSNVINRQYIRGKDQVGVMIVPSDGNRKTIHTPEYCQMGLGWKPIESGVIEFTSEMGLPSQARKLLLEDDLTGTKRTFIYWFGDENGVTIANYPMFLISDTWRKFFGRRTNWSLYVVWYDSQESSAEEFLSSLPVITPRF